MKNLRKNVGGLGFDCNFAKKKSCIFCMHGYFSRLEKVWQAPSYRHLVTREKAPKAATLAALQLLV